MASKEANQIPLLDLLGNGVHKAQNGKSQGKFKLLFKNCKSNDTDEVSERFLIDHERLNPQNTNVISLERVHLLVQRLSFK